HGCLLLLAFFATDLLVVVLDAFAFVGLRTPHPADLGGNLSDLLPVSACDGDGGLLFADLDRDPFGDRILDVVAVAELQVQVLAFEIGAITDAVDLEIAREPGRHAADAGGDERAAGAPHH